MAIEVIPGEAAWAAYRGNALARWPTREDPGRLHPLASPQAHTVFGLTGRERVFCIGSCFAREIENALVELGFDVLSIMRNFPRSPNRARSDRGMFNKYNVATILNELRWALDEGQPYRHEEVLIGAPGDLLLQDFQLAGVDYAEEPGFAREFRDAFNACFRTVRDAVEAFGVDRPHMSYFPSQEFAVLSNPMLVWRHDDLRHVDPTFVEHIMASVLSQSGRASAACSACTSAADC